MSKPETFVDSVDVRGNPHTGQLIDISTKEPLSKNQKKKYATRQDIQDRIQKGWDILRGGKSRAELLGGGAQ